MHIWKNHYSFPADNANCYISHLLQRLMSTIYHNLIMDFTVCAVCAVCAVWVHVFIVFILFSLFPSFPTPTSHCLSRSISFSPSQPLSLNRPPYPFHSPSSQSTRMWSDPLGSGCACSCEADKEKDFSMLPSEISVDPYRVTDRHGCACAGFHLKCNVNQ